MAKTKTASVRLPKEMYEEIDSICDDVGCSRNDWIKDTIKDRLREESNENGLDQEENTPGPDRNPTPKEIIVRDIPEPKPTLTKIPEEPEQKTERKFVKEVSIVEPLDNSNKWIDMRNFNGRYFPKAELKEV